LGAAGLPVRGEAHVMTTALPPSAPEIEIQHRETQRLTVVFHEAGAGGASPSRAKPAGVEACEIRVKVGAPAPARDADWVINQNAKRSPAVLAFDSEDIGKTIWVRARWINSRNQPGPWSLAQNTVIA
jgi:hypothetical protein